MYSVVFLAVTAFVCCLFLTPIVRRLSERAGLVDLPNVRRKWHQKPTARTGGVAIGLSYLAALGLLLVSPLNGADTVNLPLALHLLPAAAFMFLIGLLDDLRGLTAWQKLLGQVAAAVLAYVGGVDVTGVAGFAAAGWWTLPITVAWLVACANAFNLIDGMDGLATGVGLFAAFTVLAAAMLHNIVPLALATAPLVGALLAFLRYNFNPASIFLGDCGSLTIGFLLGCLSALWSQKSATLLGITAPLMALSVPLLDTAASVARRVLRGQPVFSADRNHLHHRLLDRGLSPRQVALVIYGICGFAAAFSLLETWSQNRFEGLLLVMFCVSAWVGLRLVGYIEFDTARHLIMTGTFRHIVNARLFVDDFERKVAAAKTADDYWDAIQDVTREVGFPHVRMSLGGQLFEHGAPDDDQLSCEMRIPLAESDYVNFKYPVRASVRHSVAIASVVTILQRSIDRPLERTAAHDQRSKVGYPTPIRVVRPLKTAR